MSINTLAQETDILGYMTKPFLKWPGGKYRLAPTINEYIDGNYKLVDVFSGGGSVWLNSKTSVIVANDLNKDVINCFKNIETRKTELLLSLDELFSSGACLDVYLKNREEFNSCQDSFRRSCLFIYLNKYGFNGLCRYNKNGIFNVHFGGRNTPIDPPVNEIHKVYDFMKNRTVTFEVSDYKECIPKHDNVGTMFYLDPPYIPINSISFTKYSGSVFGLNEHTSLSDICKGMKADFLMSNSDTEMTREIYKGFYFKEINVLRSISVDKRRYNEKELLISNTDITNTLFHSAFNW